MLYFPRKSTVVYLPDFERVAAYYLRNSEWGRKFWNDLTCRMNSLWRDDGKAVKVPCPRDIAPFVGAEN